VPIFINIGPSSLGLTKAHAHERLAMGREAFTRLEEHRLDLEMILGSAACQHGEELRHHQMLDRLAPSARLGVGFAVRA